MSEDKSNICNAQVDDEAIQRRVEIANKRVKMLLDELKTVFAPHMLLTFFVRDPRDPDCYSLLTEETDLNNVINYLSNLPAQPNVLPKEQVGNA